MTPKVELWKASESWDAPKVEFWKAQEAWRRQKSSFGRVQEARSLQKSSFGSIQEAEGQNPCSPNFKAQGPWFRVVYILRGSGQSTRIPG